MKKSKNYFVKRQAIALLIMVVAVAIFLVVLFTSQFKEEQDLSGIVTVLILISTTVSIGASALYLGISICRETLNSVKEILEGACTK